MTVLNMLIGVLCQMVIAVGETEREEITINILKEALWPLCEQFLQPGQELEDIQISQANFFNLLERVETAKVLHEIEVDVNSLVDLSDTVFTDRKGQERYLDLGELVSTLLSFRSSSKATVKDLAAVRRLIDEVMDSQDDVMQQRILTMHADINALGKMVEQVGGIAPGTVQKGAERRMKQAKLMTDLMCRDDAGKMGTLSEKSKWRSMRDKLRCANALDGHQVSSLNSWQKKKDRTLLWLTRGAGKSEAEQPREQVSRWEQMEKSLTEAHQGLPPLLETAQVLEEAGEAQSLAKESRGKDLAEKSPTLPLMGDAAAIPAEVSRAKELDEEHEASPMLAKAFEIPEEVTASRSGEKSSPGTIASMKMTPTSSSSKPPAKATPKPKLTASSTLTVGKGQAGPRKGETKGGVLGKSQAPTRSKVTSHSKVGTNSKFGRSERNGS